MHVVRTLPSEVLTAVRDLTREVTAAMPEPYLLIKDALLSPHRSPLQMCFKLLDLPLLGDRRPSMLFAEMQSLLPRDANVLFNAMFLRRLPEAMRTALVDRGDRIGGKADRAVGLRDGLRGAGHMGAVGGVWNILGPCRYMFNGSR